MKKLRYISNFLVNYFPLLRLSALFLIQSDRIINYRLPKGIPCCKFQHFFSNRFQFTLQNYITSKPTYRFQHTQSIHDDVTDVFSQFLQKSGTSPYSLLWASSPSLSH